MKVNRAAKKYSSKVEAEAIDGNMIMEETVIKSEKDLRDTIKIEEQLLPKAIFNAIVKIRKDETYRRKMEIEVWKMAQNQQYEQKKDEKQEDKKYLSGRYEIETEMKLEVVYLTNDTKT